MIVLTGGAGFIGSCFLRKLNDEGISDVLVVDHLGNNDKWKNLLGKKFKDYINKDDFLVKLNNNHYKGEIDSIIHLGACSSTTERNADYLMNNNFSYSKNLAVYSADNDIKLIYASSAATYGDGSFGYSDDEYDTLVPLNGYGFSKHIFDLWLIENKLDTKFTGIKFFNVFGPNEYHKGEMSSMVFKSYKQIISNGKVNLFKSNDIQFNDGEQRRDFIYVKDCNDVIWQMLRGEHTPGIYNLGTGKSRTWNDLVNSVFRALSTIDSKFEEVNIEYIDMPEHLNTQYQNFTEADMTNLNNSGIKFTPQELEATIADYVINYLYKNYSIY